MTLLHRLSSIVRGIFRRDRAEHELDDELQTFVELAAADKIREGVAPAEARRLAHPSSAGWSRRRNAFGRVAMARWLDEIGRDIRYAVPVALQGSRVHRARGPDAGPGHRRELGDLQPDRRADAPHGCRSRPAELVLVEMGEQGCPRRSFSYAMARALSERHDDLCGCGRVQWQALRRSARLVRSHTCTVRSSLAGTTGRWGCILQPAGFSRAQTTNRVRRWWP